jgi:DNA-binding XRE family transcriptional regulator
MLQTRVSLEEKKELRRVSILLKHARLRIPPNSRSIGGFERVASRIGKQVSQEELAEAIGVTRSWYGCLEASQPGRASLKLLVRICHALMLDERESLALIGLCFAELRERSDLPSMHEESAHFVRRTHDVF